MASKNRGKRKVSEGIVHINATFNNTIIAISDMGGNVLCHCSAGAAGFKGARKSTPFAAQVAADLVARKAAQEFGLKRVAINVKGPGSGRESAIRGINNAGLDVIHLKDNTSIPHNGCRPRKKRRV